MMSEHLAAKNGNPVTDGELSSDIEPWNESAQLNETETPRSPLFRETRELHRAANTLAVARRTVRLLWIGLLVSVAANLFIPVYVVSIMKRPEKVALLDGTESLIIAPLVPPEESREIIETLSIWAAKAYLDRGPQGFDMPETLARVFLPQAAKRANEDFKIVAEESAKKNIHQKVEIGRIDLQHLQNGVIVSRVVGQLLTQAQVGDEVISEPQPITLDLKLVRNPYLGRNQRYPYAVQDYSFGKAEQLSLQKQQNR